MRVQLPWYCFDFLADGYARLWLALRELLIHEGFRDLPDLLDSATDLDEVLQSSQLFLSQTCGYDLAVDLPVPLRIVGTASFAAPGCGRGTYRSLLLTPRSSDLHGVEDLDDVRFVANDRRSWSGYHALRKHHARFASIHFSGGHRLSLHALREGRADLACIDSVSWTLLVEAQPELAELFRVIGWTDEAPAPPIVTSAARSPAEVKAMRRALGRLPEVSPDICARLRWRDFVVHPESAYRYMAGVAIPLAPPVAHR